MHEILANLPAHALVLDLGSAKGSFTPTTTQASVIRLDRDFPAAVHGGNLVQADAARLPFPDASIHAIIANHSLEHFEDLNACLHEIRRVIHPDGALYIAVPDASTVTDRLYRWLAGGGGHVNPFTDPEQVAALIEQATGLKHAATTTLCSSLSFLHHRNSPRPRPRRLHLLGNGSTASLLLYTWLSRRIDPILRRPRPKRLYDCDLQPPDDRGE